MSTLFQPDAELVVDQFAIDNIQGDGSVFQVASVALDYINLPGDNIETMIDATFTLAGHGGVFLVAIPWSREWDTELAATIGLRAQEILDVYAA